MQKKYLGSNSLQFLLGVCFLLSSSASSAPAPAPTTLNKIKRAQAPVTRTPTSTAPVTKKPTPTTKAQPTATPTATAKPIPVPSSTTQPIATPTPSGTAITYGMTIKISNDNNSGGIWRVMSVTDKTGQIQNGDTIYLVHELGSKDQSTQRKKDPLSLEIQGGGSWNTNSTVGFTKKKKDHNAYLAIVSTNPRKLDDQQTITISHIKFNNKPFYWKAMPQTP